MPDSADSSQGNVHNTSLVGNINVSIRFRSLNDRERDGGNQIAWQIDALDNSVRCMNELNRGNVSAFVFGTML